MSFLNYALELYLNEEIVLFIDFNTNLGTTAMNLSTAPMSLFTLFLVLFCNAQDHPEELPLNQMLPYTNSSAKNIMEQTSSLKNHSSLFRVLKASKLDEVLGYKGAFTVFAPTNMAFEKLSNNTIDQLLDPKNQKILKTILAYHIIAGKFSASSILRAMCRGNGIAEFTTIQGEKIKASMRGIDIILTDKLGNEAVILTADSNQSNGIIHEIDTVFLPATLL